MQLSYRHALTCQNCGPSTGAMLHKFLLPKEWDYQHHSQRPTTTRVPCRYSKDLKGWEKTRLTTDIVQNHASVGRRTEPLQNWVPALLPYLSLSFSKSPFPTLPSWEKKHSSNRHFLHERQKQRLLFFGLCRVGDEQRSYQRCSWRTHSGGSPSLKKCAKKLSGSKDYQQKPPNGCHDFWFDIKKVYGNSERFSCQKHKHSLKTLKKHIIFAHFAHLLTPLPGRTPPRKLRRSASAPEAETAAPKAKRQLVATRQGNTAGLVTADPLLTWALPAKKAR